MRFRGVFMDKAKNLAEIRRTCANYPLDRDELTHFYVDTSKARGVDMLTRLTKHFDYVPNIYQQVLYLGHRGSGKSTILYQLEQKLNSVYEIIRYSVQEMLDIKNLTLVDLLFSMYERIFFIYANIIKDDDSDYEIINTIYEKWYSATKIEEETHKKSTISVDFGGEVKPSIKIAKLFAKLNTAFRFNTSEKEIVLTNVKNSIPDYILYLNQLIELISKKVGKPLLFMFEDLEKISRPSAQTLFLDQAKYIPMIKAHLLLTTPIYFKYSMEFRRDTMQYFPDTERCPMISLTDAQKNKNEYGYKTMKEIVYARVQENLIDEDTLELAITYSGGVIRDLFAIIREASLSSEINGKLNISKEDIENAFVAFQETFSDIVHDVHIPVIENVYQNPQGPICTSDLLIELMCAEVIIEYNGEQWRGVHPAVSAYLEKRGILNCKKEDK